MSDKRNARARANRRRFLKHVAVGGSAAALAAAAGIRPAIATETKTSSVPTPKAAPKGYHVTAHIQEYYKVAGL